ncbi:hypothetical protein SmJEL517_g02741 [Synchytrium microbalum]|uniref:Gamma-secretase subunit PEN-2 n=1 Tax=Synchytrium microbalum TaxID=1806994 RepID=A0A507CAX8_9FUNG|nr:uncharacterized protein SmJEL517_g02741 [Synchytrium microbalum]TPX34685.1 hypothetical protein SmJEL517_g02741 [Synchytrium microbalum]
MRLEKLPEAEILKTARYMFYGGWLFLPWLWLVAFIYILPVTRKRPELNPRIAQYAWWSFVGSMVWLVIALAWLSIYLTQRVKWGAGGDRISVSLPPSSSFFIYSTYHIFFAVVDLLLDALNGNDLKGMEESTFAVKAKVFGVFGGPTFTLTKPALPEASI